jgi:hypothetical protein
MTRNLWWTTPNRSCRSGRWASGMVCIAARWLLADRVAPRTQRYTAKRIHRRLVDEHGADVAEVTVRQYVRSRQGPVTHLLLGAEALTPGVLGGARTAHAGDRVGGMRDVFVDNLRRLTPDSLGTSRDRRSGRAQDTCRPCRRRLRGGGPRWRERCAEASRGDATAGPGSIRILELH